MLCISKKKLHIYIVCLCTSATGLGWGMIAWDGVCTFFNCSFSHVFQGYSTVSTEGEKVCPCALLISTTPWRRYGGVDVEIHIFLTSDLVGGEWSASRSDRFTLGDRAPGTHWIGGWVDPRAGLHNMEKWKFLIPSGLELRPLGCPASSKSLYWLRYPSTEGVYFESLSFYKTIIIYVTHNFYVIVANK
jgi:hypothetical protein